MIKQIVELVAENVGEAGLFINLAKEPGKETGLIIIAQNRYLYAKQGLDAKAFHKLLGEGIKMLEGDEFTDE